MRFIKTTVYEYIVPGARVTEATFWPPETANAWDGTWHSHGSYGTFIRYVTTFWGGGCFERAMPAPAPAPDPWSNDRMW
jgi:hypothetical protein